MLKKLPFLSNFINLGFIQVSNAVVQITLFPIIIRIIGLHEFGYVMVANSYAALTGLFINYGTNQSGIKDVAIYKSDHKALNNIFYTVYYTRILLFILSLFVLAGLYFLKAPNVLYFFSAYAIVLAEMFNPLFFFIGMEKLFLFNIVNLIAKLIAVALILLWVKTPADSLWVNCCLGVGNIAAYIFLFIYLVRKHHLYSFRIALSSIARFLKSNFFLTGNSLFVQLQQSFFLFTLSGVASPLVLGAYSFCDKIVWSFRLLIISFSSAVYPRAAVLYKEQHLQWQQLKQKINLYLGLLFIAGAIVLFATAPWIVSLLTGMHDPLTAAYVRAISLVPLFAALNAMNVIDLLVKGKYNYLFHIGLILCGIAMLMSFFFVYFGDSRHYGYYPVMIEACSLPLYLAFIKSIKHPSILIQ